MAKTLVAQNAWQADSQLLIDLTVQDRSLHLVDLENLLGDPWATGPRVGWALEQYFEVAGWQHGDLVYVAANPHLVKEFCFQPTVDWNVHAARGRDGADLALLAHAAPEFVARRAGRMVVGSGDHIFADRARQVAAAGVEVLVVARSESRSRELAIFPFCAFDSELSPRGDDRLAPAHLRNGGAIAA